MGKVVSFIFKQIGLVLIVVLYCINGALLFKSVESENELEVNSISPNIEILTKKTDAMNKYKLLAINLPSIFLGKA